KVRKRIDDTALSYIGFRPNYIPQNYIGSQIPTEMVVGASQSYSYLEVTVNNFIVDEESEQSPWGFVHNGCGISKRLKEKTIDKLERKTDELKKNNNHISITIADTNEQEDSLEEKSNHSNDQENYLKRLEDLEAFRILLEKNFIDTSLINSIKKDDIFIKPRTERSIKKRKIDEDDDYSEDTHPNHIRITMEETIILGQTIDPLELVKFLQNIDISTIDKPINLFNLSLLIQQMYKEASSTVSMIQETLLSSSNHHCV
ncbi:6346_t:CDS:2, partial [Entrophospora sp. SA101]